MNNGKRRRRIGGLLIGLMAALGAAMADAQTPMRPISAPHGMAASANALPSQVGVSIMKRGGNAVDAAAAVGLALAVVYPQAGNLGGGGFMLIRMADGHSAAIDYRETAPTAARKTMYLDSRGEIIPQSSLVGYRAVGVPGTVAGLAYAQRKYGRLPWRVVVEPARRLAAHGFPLTPQMPTHCAPRRTRWAGSPPAVGYSCATGAFIVPGTDFSSPNWRTRWPAWKPKARASSIRAAPPIFSPPI